MECAGRAQQRPEHYTHSGRIFPVAQTSSLLYRGFPIRKRWEVRRPCRLEVGDTAGLETCATSALRNVYNVQAGTALWLKHSPGITAHCSKAIAGSSLCFAPA